MKSSEIRQRFLDFFKLRGHAILPSASVVPVNDPSVLFTTAGMQPLVPYLLGEKHPQGKRLANVQKCIRLTDVDEVGDTTHSTFFEMLGNWSLGDYFKKESIEWSFEFLTSKEHGLGIDPRKIYVTVFAGDKISPKDTASIEVWKEVYAKAGIDARVYDQEDLKQNDKNLNPSYRIFLLGKEDNWWPSGGKNPGPQGPDTEIFYYWGKNDPDLKQERPGYNDDNFWEIWNNVFMEYNRKDGGFSSLTQKNVDTGMGLERVAAVLQGHPDIYKSDLYAPIINILEYESGQLYNHNFKIHRAMRIIADHLRTAVFILGDDAKVTPSNLGKGYVLRRLIRRSLRYQKLLDIDGENKNFLEQLARTIVENYAEAYPELGRNFNYILEELKAEQERFEKTLGKGLKEWEKIAEKGKISGEEAFRLFSTYGFPLELTIELAQENKITVDQKGFQKAFSVHQKISRNGAEKRFKGGLIDDSYETTKLHTTTHLLQAALRTVLGPEVMQKGSNITPDRLRFDFSYSQKVTEDEKKKIEELVNNAIQSRLPVEKKEVKYADALKMGALGVFEKKYGEKVKVFTVGNPSQPFSREICGGPHVKNTSELGKFKIIKEEAVSAGVRRIKAILE